MKTLLLLPAVSLISLANAQEPQQPSPDGVNGRTPATAGSTQLVRDEAPGRAADALAATPALARMNSPIPIHTQPADPVGGEYGIWAAGEKYKVSFHGDMTFVPYLGADYPYNQPLTWRTTSVRIGGEELLGAGEVPVRSHGNLEYRYRYGSFSEVYDVGVAGLEQSFVIDRPTGSGDLIVEGALTTRLHGEPVADRHQPIRFFDDEQREILTYGKAFAIDANGRKAEMTSTLDGSVMRLRLDARWLAEATFPVTVDPIVTPVLIDWGTARESVDICRDDTANDRMYTFIRAASATDKDVYARIVEDDYSTGTYVFSDINTSWSHQQTRVAAADSPQKYAVVYDRSFTTGTSAIRYHIHDSGDLTPSTTVNFLSWTSTIQDWRADVGGTLLGGLGDEFMIVYQRDAGTSLANTANSEIWAVTIDITAATPVQGTPFAIPPWGTGTSLDMERPSINKQAAPTSNTVWAVVWQEYWNNHPNPPDDWDACGRLIDANGSVSAGSWVTLLESNQNRHQLGPVVAGSSGRYCVAFAGGDMSLINFKTAVINGTSVNAERFNWSNFSGSPQRFSDKLLWGVHNDRRWRVGGIAYDSNSDSHWALTSLSDTVYSGTGNVYIDRVGYTGAGLESATLYSATANHNGDPGGVVFDDDNIEMATAWVQNDTTATSTTAGVGVHDIFATSFTYPVPSSAPAMSGTTCSAAALSWSPGISGSGQQIGSEFTQVNVNGLPAGALNFIGVSTQTSNVLVVGPSIAAGCRLLISDTAGFLGYFPLIIGSSGSARLSLPEWLPPMNLYFQDWYIDAATNIVYSTQRLTVPITK